MTAIKFRTTANEKLLQRKAELKGGAVKMSTIPHHHNDIKLKDIVLITPQKTLKFNRIWRVRQSSYRVDPILIRKAIDRADSKQWNELADILSIYIGLASFGPRERFKEVEDVIRLFVEKNIISPLCEDGKRRTATTQLTSVHTAELIAV